ncbi:MAG: 5-formyltetrahydrofolate cyclo-ligase [Halanaeroarchaeum sp.]
MDKQAIREEVWDDLEEAGVARFPVPPHGRIPNVAGADDAAARLADLSAWQAAEAVKANPDAPQLPVRRRALRAGVTVFMAVPRLSDQQPFLRLDPAEIEDREAAPTVSHVEEYGTAVGPDALPRIDLIVAGSVAVTPSGDRVGKGEGYSDLEFAVLSEAGIVDRDTTIVTTVHERQVIDGPIETASHDVPMDLIVTPERAIETDRRDDRPDGIDWTALEDATIDEIPILQRLAPDRSEDGNGDQTERGE